MDFSADRFSCRQVLSRQGARHRVTGLETEIRVVSPRRRVDGDARVAAVAIDTVDEPVRCVVCGGGTDHVVLESVAREFSPRIEVCGPREITLDPSGSARCSATRGRLPMNCGGRRRTAGCGCASRLREHARPRSCSPTIEQGLRSLSQEPRRMRSEPPSLLDELINPKPKTQIPNPNHQPLTTNHQPPHCGSGAYGRWASSRRAAGR